MSKSKNKPPKSPSSKQALKPQIKSRWLKMLAWMMCIIICIFLFLVYATVFMPTKKAAYVLHVKDGDYYQKIFTNPSYNPSIFAQDFIARLFLRHHATAPLQTGRYNIDENASMYQALQVLQNPPNAEYITITVIEGKTIKDLYEILKQNDGVTKQVLAEPKIPYLWTDVAIDNVRVAEFLGIEPMHLEGQFAPDTYFFDKGTTDGQILQHLYERQQKLLQNAWQIRAKNLPYVNAYELLIMASIIEKETGLPAERPKVASVFINRLNKNMRLQTDPTIIYGLFDAYDGVIYKSNIAQKNDYNTYQMDGLPKTPIALVSNESLLAAANPDDTPFLYFVATGAGGHTFSTNLTDHNRAVAQYRQTLKP